MDIMITDDRTGNQLREQGNVGSQLDEIGLCLHLPAIDVRQVGDGLEGVEGDANRQEDTFQGDGGDTEQPAENVEVIN